jgi:hypothetical protein
MKEPMLRPGTIVNDEQVKKHLHFLRYYFPYHFPLPKQQSNADTTLRHNRPVRSHSGR